MIQITSYILRIQAVTLAVFVSMLSMGFTYHWEVCMHAKEITVCEVLEDKASCCHITLTEAPQCSCADMGDNACNLSFSKYIQFDFEVLTSDVEDLVSEVDFIAANKILVPVKQHNSLKVTIAGYRLPPPKSGRDILCFTQTLLI